MLLNHNNINRIKKIYLEHIGYDKKSESKIDSKWNSILDFIKPRLNQTIYISYVESCEQIVSFGILNKYEYPPINSMNGAECGFITHVHTLPTFRRDGYATQVIEELVDLAKEMNFYYLYLNGENKVIKLYQKAGFVPDAENTFLERYL